MKTIKKHKKIISLICFIVLVVLLFVIFKPTINVNNQTYNRTEITFDYNLDDTFISSIITTETLNPSVVLIDENNEVVKEQDLEPGQNTISWQDLDLLYDHEYVISYRIPHSIFGFNLFANPEPHEIYSETFTTAKKSPTATIYDAEKSYLDGDQLIITYDLADENNSFLEEPIITLKDENNEEISSQKAKIGTGSEAIFTIHPGEVYNIEISGAYDINHDGKAEKNTIIAQQTVQTPAIKTWDQVYGGSDSDELNQVIETSDGGYIAVGSTTSNNSGEIDGMSSGNRDALIVKFNAKGKPVWNTVIGKEGNDYFYDVTETQDNGYVAVGEFYDASTCGSNFKCTQGFVSKFDSRGNVVWSKSYGGKNNDVFEAVITTADGGFVIVGSSLSSGSGEVQDKNNGETDAVILRLDSQGELLWLNSYGGEHYEAFYDVISVEDGYIAVGESNSSMSGEINSSTNGMSDGLIVRFDSQGNVVWEQLYGGRNDDVFYQITTNKAGNYVVAGYTESNGNGVGTIMAESNGSSDGLIVEFNKNGIVENEIVYGGENTEGFFSITPTSDGGYVASGWTMSNQSGDLKDKNNGDMDALVVRFDQNGNVLFEQIFGGTKADSLDSIIRTSDGGYLGVGTTEGSNGEITDEYNGGTSDALVVKFNSKLK